MRVCKAVGSGSVPLVEEEDAATLEEEATSLAWLMVYMWYGTYLTRQNPTQWGPLDTLKNRQNRLTLKKWRASDSQWLPTSTLAFHDCF
jgi:hypothetical protein